MAITVVMTARAKSGGYQRVRDGMQELKGIIEKQGLQPRLLRPASGENQGQLMLSTEYENWAAFGAASDKLRESSGYQAMMKRAGESTDLAVESMSVNFYSTID